MPNNNTSNSPASNPNRRDFIKTVALSTAAFFIPGDHARQEKFTTSDNRGPETEGNTRKTATTENPLETSSFDASNAVLQSEKERLLPKNNPPKTLEAQHCIHEVFYVSDLNGNPLKEATIVLDTGIIERYSPPDSPIKDSLKSIFALFPQVKLKTNDEGIAIWKVSPNLIEEKGANNNIDYSPKICICSISCQGYQTIDIKHIPLKAKLPFDLSTRDNTKLRHEISLAPAFVFSGSIFNEYGQGISDADIKITVNLGDAEDTTIYRYGNTNKAGTICSIEGKQNELGIPGLPYNRELRILVKASGYDNHVEEIPPNTFSKDFTLTRAFGAHIILREQNGHTLPLEALKATKISLFINGKEENKAVSLKQNPFEANRFGLLGLKTKFEAIKITVPGFLPTIVKKEDLKSLSKEEDPTRMGADVVYISRPTINFSFFDLESRAAIDVSDMRFQVLVEGRPENDKKTQTRRVDFWNPTSLNSKQGLLGVPCSETSYPFEVEKIYLTRIHPEDHDDILFWEDGSTVKMPLLLYNKNNLQLKQMHSVFLKTKEPSNK